MVQLMKIHKDKLFSWHREEYQLLSQHYFHEDNYILKTMTLYLSLNTALIAIGSSKFVSNDSIFIHFGVPIFGIYSCFLWYFSLVRVFDMRMKVEERIKTIEKHYGRWHNLSLRIRNHESEERNFIKRMPAARYFRFFPFVLSTLWISYAGYELYELFFSKT